MKRVSLIKPWRRGKYPIGEEKIFGRYKRADSPRCPLLDVEGKCRSKTGGNSRPLFAASAANTLRPRRTHFWGRTSGAAFLRYFAPCGARPEALPLDSTTFEKVDETFTVWPPEPTSKRILLLPFRPFVLLHHQVHQLAGNIDLLDNGLAGDLRRNLLVGLCGRDGVLLANIRRHH